MPGAPESLALVTNPLSKNHPLPEANSFRLLVSALGSCFSYRPLYEFVTRANTLPLQI